MPNEEEAVGIERQCIWMKAGVINYKLCPHNYGCHLCAFDKALREKGVKKPGGIFKISWQDKLRKLAGPDRLCRHMLQGLVTFKICPNDYNCGTCEYDQMVQDRLEATETGDMRQVAGFRLPAAIHLHGNHLWVSVEYSGKCRIGFDDFSTQLFGKDREILLPTVGQEVKQNEPFMKIRAAGRDFDVPAPMDGTISVINPLHRFAKDLDPYSNGWVAFIEPGQRMLPNLKKLHFGEEALELLNKASNDLFERLSPGRKTAADGGAVVGGLISSIPADTRAQLIKDIVFGA